MARVARFPISWIARRLGDRCENVTLRDPRKWIDRRLFGSRQSEDTPSRYSILSERGGGERCRPRDESSPPLRRTNADRKLNARAIIARARGIRLLNRNPERPIKFVWVHVVCERALSACGYGSTLRTGVRGPRAAGRGPRAPCTTEGPRRRIKNRWRIASALLRRINNAPCEIIAGIRAAG